MTCDLQTESPSDQSTNEPLHLMKTRLLTRLAVLFALASLCHTPLAANPPADESNLVLLDTENPAIRDLAVIAGDASTYDSLNEKNKIGVFYSEGLKNMFLNLSYGFELLQPPPEKSGWTVEDFLPATSGPMFFVNGFVDYSSGGLIQRAPIYQALPEKDILPWKIQGNTLLWDKSASADTFHFVARLNDHSAGWDQPSSKVRLYKRFLFPSKLDYEEAGDIDFELDRKTISKSAKKLVVVVHGWNTKQDVDPFESGSWPVLLNNLNREIEGKSGYAQSWDLYAYRWGRDSYTGGLGNMLGAIENGTHSSGGVGVGQENGTQAAEIAYQHGLVLGKLIVEHCLNNNIQLEKVHFIAHSAGTWVARSASLYLKNEIERIRQASGVLTQQITLLDPYKPHEGYVGWSGNPILQGGEESALDKMDAENWVVATHPVRAENIFSRDTFTYGTNEVFWKEISRQPWQTYANRQVGSSVYGISVPEYVWDGHGGPVNFFAYTVEPGEFLKYFDSKNGKLSQKLFTWANFTLSSDRDPAGWKYSMFMDDYRFNLPPLQHNWHRHRHFPC